MAYNHIKEGFDIHTTCPGCSKPITVIPENNKIIPDHWFNNGNMCDWSYRSLNDA